MLSALNGDPETALDIHSCILPRLVQTTLISLLFQEFCPSSLLTILLMSDYERSQSPFAAT